MRRHAGDAMVVALRSLCSKSDGVSVVIETWGLGNNNTNNKNSNDNKCPVDRGGATLQALSFKDWSLGYPNTSVAGKMLRCGGTRRVIGIRCGSIRRVLGICIG